MLETRRWLGADGKQREVRHHHVYQAGLVVETFFPTATEQDVFRVLTSLNLLNAAVKQRGGAELVSYHYIKGMAACLFVHLVLHHVEGVTLYWDSDEDITYFSVFGWQISFHYVAFTAAMKRLIRRAKLEPQQWDGLRLQQVAVQLFKYANPQVEECGCDMMALVKHRLLRRPTWQPLYYYHHRTSALPMFANRGATPEFCEKCRRTLYKALTFNIFRSQGFTLYRRRDNLPLRMMRYTGSNYDRLIEFLSHANDKVVRRKEDTLEVGKLYYVTPKMHMRALSQSQYARCLVHHSYIKQRKGFSTLCVTYNIALYLAQRYPTLKFINIANYHNGRRVRRLYGLRGLLSLSQHAPARRLKAWIPFDQRHLLYDLQIDDIPMELVQEYAEMPDYYKEYEVVRRDGLCGLLAYRQRMLLPVKYPNIFVYHYSAYVQNSCGQWAVYSLEGEHFISSFCYETWAMCVRGVSLMSFDKPN